MTQTHTAPTDADLADVLDRAADHLERVGLHQGDMYDDRQANGGTPVTDCRVCARGSIYVGVSGTPRLGLEEPRLIALADGAERVLRTHLGLSARLPQWAAVPMWSDVKGRTATEVVAAMRAAATGLRSGETG